MTARAVAGTVAVPAEKVRATGDAITDLETEAGRILGFVRLADMLGDTNREERETPEWSWAWHVVLDGMRAHQERLQAIYDRLHQSYVPEKTLDELRAEMLERQARWHARPGGQGASGVDPVSWTVNG